MVDDDPVFLQVLGKAMGKRGFDVVTAAGINDAVAKALEILPDMAVVDLKLEGESGLDLIPLLIEINPQMNIVVLTGLDDDSTAVEAVREGAQDYLIKGQFDPNSLVRSVRHAMERSRIETALQEAHEENSRLLASISLALIGVDEDNGFRPAGLIRLSSTAAFVYSFVMILILDLVIGIFLNSVYLTIWPEGARLF